MDGAIFLQQVVNGMSLGGMYALIAIGYTMVYGVLRLINFAHADVMMVGAFSTLFLFSSVGLPFGVAVFLTLGLCGLFGMLIDRVAYRPLRQASKISMLITAIGVSFFLENLFNVLFGGSSRFFSAPDFFNQTRAFGSVIITNVAWIVPLITVLLLLAILWLLYRTRYGMAIRAVAFDVNTVRLMGIDANRIISLVFALGSSLAALGGVFYSISYPTIDPLMGVLIGLKAFAAAVLGGIGSTTGALLGTVLVVGSGEWLRFLDQPLQFFGHDLGAYPGLRMVVFSLLLLIIMLFAREGLLGKKEIWQTGRRSGGYGGK
ncbi:TPA: branched-chain amino acid ABC transporter permease [Klebsiella pneumoniae]|nr:branched-chain amino acid ABC transporter permease [Klebsiella pneumoniae]MCL0455259.1 branched-chain amino acid ABC transporter permease [Klebsiella pneumoniae]MCL0519218.1 branched-chain amino acid ABC transporter permease [Klebsiella pneumoniae]